MPKLQTPSPSSHDIAVVVVVVAGIVVIMLVVYLLLWLGYGRELGGLIGASQCRVIAENGLDLTSICYPSRPAAQAPPFPHHQYSHHHDDQHVSTMNASTMTIPAALAPPLPTSYI